MKLKWFVLGAAATVAAFTILPVLVGMVLGMGNVRSASHPAERLVFVDCGGPGMAACHGKVAPAAAAPTAAAPGPAPLPSQ